MGEVVTLLTSASGHSLVKSFTGQELSPQPFSTGKLFNVSEEPVSDLQSLSALLHRLEDDPTHTIIRGSLVDGQSSQVQRNNAETLRRNFQKFDDITTHGFRNTFKTWCLNYDVEEFLADRYCDHALKGLDKNYRRDDLFDQRAELAERYMRFIRDVR